MLPLQVEDDDPFGLGQLLDSAKRGGEKRRGESSREESSKEKRSRR